uniref:Zinc finger CCCH-type containing 7B n=1 Tax=Oryzias sinensis TaxID=183150 RepID=A0A8C7X976_9TELE
MFHDSTYVTVGFYFNVKPLDKKSNVAIQLITLVSKQGDYLTQLVCNLLEEGNAFFKDGLCDQAAREFTEGLNVSSYAESEEIQIPVALQESLFVNRAAAYHSMGKYDESIADCNMALEVCKQSRRALYRKALCLKELGRYREAYDCTSECLLSCPEDKQGKELAQELTVLLGLKTRKPYVSTKVKELSKVYHLHPYFVVWMWVSCSPADNTFRFACINYIPPLSGVGIYTFVHKPDLVHNCKRDVLLCRRKEAFSSEWTRVRRLPPKVSFSGPFVLCKDLGVCKYGENCTFAYNQLEIDVWTEERKGTLDRNLLFGAEDGKLDPVNSIICLLRENKGMFIFLCQVSCCICCQRLENKLFEDSVSKLNVNYNKVRPLSPLCHLDLCRPAIRYGCLREDDCLHAHSVIELKTWKIHLCVHCACGGGLTSEPDKTLKYCKSKARHAWTKDRRVLLVMSSERSKWVQVRPLPHTKNFPFYYDVGLTGKVQAEDAPSCHPNYEEKCIIMPTDYADQLVSEAEVGFHCRLCGKHSNSQRQWQQHISSEKHKDRVFSCEGEDEALTWRYRFPGCICVVSRMDGGCSEGVSCDFAHSAEELQEWIERRDFLRQKLAKAREDMLVLPDELDFGKFNFLLQD